MPTKKLKFFILRTLSLIAVPLAAIVIINVFLSKASTADQSIVEGVKPLPVMQQAVGQKIFADNCAQCHGRIADGIEGKGPPLVHPYYNPGHHSDVAFFRAAEQGVQAHHWPFGDMPAQPQVNTTQMQQVILYLRELQRANGIH